LAGPRERGQPLPHEFVPKREREFAKRLRTGQTSLEDLLWRELRAKRLDGWKFKRQVNIDGKIVDFICFERRLVVEVDGPIHAEPEQRAKDGERDLLLAAKGFRTLRFDGDLILSYLARVVADI